MSILKQQPQIAQLELLFSGPLIKDSQVETLNDLTSLDIRYNYLHKIVWVKSLKTNYFLNENDGSLLTHWKKHTSNLIIEQYQPNVLWFAGDIVYLGNIIYKALIDIQLNEDPINYKDKWLVITGETITQRFIVNNVPSIIIYTSIRSPFFQIIKGDLVYDVNSNLVFEDGLVKIINQEHIEAFIERREDLVDNNGKAYEISFFENNLPKNLTGVINIK